MVALKTQVIQPIRGIDVSRPGEFIDVRATSNCSNIEITRGVLRKRLGTDNLGTGFSERVMGLSELESGITSALIRVGTTKIELYNKSTDTWSSIAHAALAGTEEDEVNFAFPLISAIRNMVFTNGVDSIYKTSGTTTALLGGTPPKCKFLLDFAGYLILAYVIDGGDYFSRVQWSDSGDPETWTGGNSGSQELLEDSLPITGISVFGDYVAVHKESAIWLGQLVTSQDTFRFTRRECGAGTIANKSIQNLPTGEQIFLARDGIRIFNGVTSELIDSPIIDELRDSMNPQYVYRATSTLVKDLDEYWVGIPIGSAENPSTVYKYNYRTGQVYKDDRPGLTQLALSKRITDETWDSDAAAWDSDTTRWDSVNSLSLHKQVVFGDEDGVVTMRTSAAEDNGVAIDGIWDSKDFTILDIDPSRPIGTLIRFDRMEVWAKGSGVTVYYSTDSGSTWNTISTLSLDSDYPTDDAPDYLYFDKVSSKIRFRFRNSTLGETFTMKQFWISAKPREVRK